MQVSFFCCSFAINPSQERNLVIESNTRGYFLAGSSNEVKRLEHFLNFSSVIMIIIIIIIIIVKNNNNNKMIMPL